MAMKLRCALHIVVDKRRLLIRDCLHLPQQSIKRTKMDSQSGLHREISSWVCNQARVGAQVDNPKSRRDIQ